MTEPLAIYEQACADIEKLALDHGITREQAIFERDVESLGYEYYLVRSIDELIEVTAL